MRGTSISCELRDNTIRGSAFAGVVLCARAAATLADNRIVESGSTGLEVYGACHDLLITRNAISGTAGVGMLVREGSSGSFKGNVVRDAGATSLEICGCGSDVCIEGNQFLGGRSGFGVLLGPGAEATISDNEVRGHPLGGVEIAAGACPTLCGNTVGACGGAGVLIDADGGGTLRKNTIADNLRHGIECCSSHAALLLEHNTISGHKRGSGVVVRAGGGGRWHDNVISGNLVGVDVVDGARPELLRNRIHANAREGLTIGQGSVASVVDCTVRANGKARVAHATARRGPQVPLDDMGAGIVVRAGGEALMRGNQISMNAGAGVFAHADSTATLTANVFRGNKGMELAARPLSRMSVADTDLRSTDPTRAVTPQVVRRQRTPFDWTIGSNVSAEDKSLAERAAEYRAQYEAMRGSDKMESGIAMLPPGADATQVCALQ